MTPGPHVTSAADGAGWLALYRDVTARGLTGIAPASSPSSHTTPRDVTL